MDSTPCAFQLALQAYADRQWLILDSMDRMDRVTFSLFPRPILDRDMSKKKRHLSKIPPVHLSKRENISPHASNVLSISVHSTLAWKI
jgi:hypothetical protein